MLILLLRILKINKVKVNPGFIFYSFSVIIKVTKNQKKREMKYDGEKY